MVVAKVSMEVARLCWLRVSLAKAVLSGKQKFKVVWWLWRGVVEGFV